MITLSMSKHLLLPLIVAVLVSLPLISVMSSSARADFTPPPDSGQPSDDDGSASSSY